jgi:dienelactone hydrolase
VGESEGEVPRVTAAGLASLDAWYVPEIRAALDCVAQEASPEGSVLVGHCNDARSAVVAAAEDPRVRGVAAWAMPLRSDADPAPAAELDRAIGQLGKRAIPVLWTFGTRDPALGAFHAYLEGVATRPSGLKVRRSNGDRPGDPVRQLKQPGAGG